MIAFPVHLMRLFKRPATMGVSVSHNSATITQDAMTLGQLGQRRFTAASLGIDRKWMATVTASHASLFEVRSEIALNSALMNNRLLLATTLATAYDRIVGG